MGLGFRVEGLGLFLGLGFRVEGLGFFLGLGFRAPGSVDLGSYGLERC